MAYDEPLSQEEMEELAAALEEADEIAMKSEYLQAAKMPCPECGGSGQMAAGSLGAAPCLGCNGARFVDHPAMVAQPRHPVFKQLGDMRARFRTYTDLVDAEAPLRALAAAAANVPNIAEVQKVGLDLAKAAMALPGAPQQQHQLERGTPSRREDDWGQDDWDDDSY